MTERRLTAILAADVVGYSRLIGADEEGTLARLKALRHELINPAIAQCRGRVVKTMGDGILIEFPSVVEAVRCAIVVQQGTVQRNRGLNFERRIEFRVGIHLGDVVADGDDILGDGVNIAARLEGISETGGVALSEDAYRHVQGKVAAEFVDLGEHALKNIARPVRVYGLEVTTGAAAQPTAPAFALPDKPSIAVLPFQNMSGDPEQEYFADGMVEEIITGLSRIRWLLVIARNSSFVYKGKPVDVKQIGRELGVRYILEGSVRKAANRVRITGQLIDAGSGAHLWAERYDGSLDDIFALQDEITLAVVGAIEPSLRHAEIERVKRKRPDNLDAYDVLLRAWPLLYSRMPEDATKAIPLFQKALELDPAYGLAHAALAWCFHARFYRGGHNEEDDLAAIRHARATIALGTDDASALAIVAFVFAQQGERDYETALRLFDRALMLSPSCVLALSYGAAVLGTVGKTDLAIERAEKALRVSPFDPFISVAHAALSFAYFTKDRFPDAVDAARRAIESNPRFSFLHAELAAALAGQGRLDEAKTAARQLLAIQPNFTLRLMAEQFLGRDPAFIAPFLAALRAAGLPE